MHTHLRLAGRMRRLSAAALVILAASACNTEDLLTVTDPDNATPASLGDASTLPAQRAGVISEFQVAMGSGGENGQVTMSALFTDEFVWAETFPTRFEVDARSVQPVNGTMSGIFSSIQRARAAAARTAAQYAALNQGTNPDRAEVLALEGLTYVNLAENYCNGVPVSTFTLAGEEQLGQPLSNQQLLQAAVARFDTALAALGTQTAAAAVRARNLARVGKARALLNLNQPALAAAEAAQVTAGFTYQLSHSENSGRQNNGIFLPTYGFPRYSIGRPIVVANPGGREGVNGLPFRADSADPRVANLPPRTGTATAGFPVVGADGQTAMFYPLAHATRSAPLTVANQAEARLIVAENLLRGGGTAFLDTLNAMRAGIALPALTDPGSQAAREDLLFRERAYWLFLTGHRLGDLRRLIRQYGRGAETVFPSGSYFKGGTYGVDVNFPVPFDETNNPNFVQCTDRNP